jgi:hypothetical protein
LAILFLSRAVPNEAKEVSSSLSTGTSIMKMKINNGWGDIWVLDRHPASGQYLMCS